MPKASKAKMWFEGGADNVATRLERYIASVKDRLAAPVPEKHKGHMKEFKAFLQNDLALTQNRLDNIKLKVPATLAKK